MKNPQTPNVSVVLWEFPDAESMKKIDKLIAVSYTHLTLPTTSRV